MRFPGNNARRRKVVERCPGGPSRAWVILVDWRCTIIRRVSASRDRVGAVKRAVFFLRKYRHRSCALLLLHLSCDLSNDRSVSGSLFVSRLIPRLQWDCTPFQETSMQNHRWLVIFLLIRYDCASCRARATRSPPRYSYIDLIRLLLYAYATFSGMLLSRCFALLRVYHEPWQTDAFRLTRLDATRADSGECYLARA